MADKTFVTVQSGGFGSSIKFDEAFLPSTTEKDALVGSSGTPGSGNKFVTDQDARVPTTDENAALAGPGGYTPSASDTYITESYYQDKKDALDWQDSIDHGIDYVKTDAGAPSGTPIAGEKCLNTNEAKLYEESALSWDAGAAVSSGDRFCHFTTGDDDSGDSGNHTKDNKIYEYDGAAFASTTPNAGYAALFEDEGSAGIRRTYNATTTTWVKFDSLSDHNSLSGVLGSAAGYHISSDQYAGINGATAISASNKVITETDRQKVPVKYSFTYRNGLGQSQTRNMFAEGDVALYNLMPKAGSIVGISVVSSDDRSGGEADFKPTIDGVAITAAGLLEKLDAGDVNDEYSTVAPGTANATFVAGKKLGCQGISDASWATDHASNEENIAVDLLVVFD